MNNLSDKRVCILVASGFAEQQFSFITKGLLKTGAVLKTVAPETGLVHGWLGNDWGHYFPVDVQIAEALGSDFDCIIFLGGARAVEKLKSNLHVQRILRHFTAAGKPVIAIEEALELLARYEALAGREVSALPGSTAIAAAAGATVIKQNVTSDGPLLTFARFEGEDLLDTLIPHLAGESACVPVAA
jgi:protease I